MLHLDENILQDKTHFICLQFGSKCDFQSDWNSQSSEHVTGNATQNTRPSSHVRESLGTRPYTCSSYSPQGNIKGRPSSLQSVMCTFIFIVCTKLLHSQWRITPNSVIIDNSSLLYTILSLNWEGGIYLNIQLDFTINLMQCYA